MLRTREMFFFRISIGIIPKMFLIILVDRIFPMCSRSQEVIIVFFFRFKRYLEFQTGYHFTCSILLS